jgi:hypothetical protein
MNPTWCAWCNQPIRIGIVTEGGVVYHLACWRQRLALLRRHALLIGP